MKKPRTAYDQVSGAYYFARMLDKIRLNGSGTLHEDYVPNLGIALDGRMCRFLRVEYPDLVREVLAGKSDDEAWEWCMKKGRGLSEGDIEVWNGFISKYGWNDSKVEALEDNKRKSGLGNRADLRTFFEYYEVDEGRRP